MIFNALVTIFFSNLTAAASLLPDPPAFWLAEFVAAVSYFKIKMFYVNEFLPINTIFESLIFIVTTILGILIYKTVRQLVRGV